MAKYNSKFPGMYDGAQQFSNVERQLDRIERDLLGLVNSFYAPESQMIALRRQIGASRQGTSDMKQRIKAIASVMRNITDVYSNAERNACDNLDQAKSSFLERIRRIIQQLQYTAVLLGLNPANIFSIDPVNLATGNYVYENTFLDVPYDLPLSFRLFYNTLSGAQGAVGGGWLHNFEIKLIKLEEGVIEIVFNDSSAKRFFTAENGQIEPLPGTTARLAKTGEGYSYRELDGMIYDFDDAGLFVSQSDKVGNRLKIEYSESGRLLKAENDCGDRLAYSYGAGGKLESVSDHTGRSVSLAYSNGLLTGVTGVMGSKTAYSYDEAGRLAEITGPNGVLCLVNEYDENSRASKQYFPDGGVMTYEYADDENLLILTEQNGNTVSYEHDEQMRNVRTAYSDGEEFFEYNSNNQRTAYTDKLGRRSEYSYDLQGNMTRFMNALGEVVEISYTKDSMPEAISLGGLVLYESAYNESGKEISMTDALGRRNGFDYDEAGNVTVMTMPDGSAERLTYDDKGNVNSIVSANGGRHEYIYDDLHRVICSTDANGNKTEFTYNAKNDIVSVLNAEGNTCGYEYDNCGNVTRITDYNGAAVEIAYNSINKPERVTDRSGGVTTIEYDKMWNVSKVTNPDGSVTSYVYNNANKLESVTAPNGAETYLKYDACGNLIERVRPDGAVYSIAYDALNRPVEVTDPEGGTARASFTQLGDVSSIELSDGRKRTFEHDVMGQMTSETGFGGHTVYYEYNTLGLVTRVYDDRGDIRKNEYYPGGLLKAELNADGCSFSYAYDLSGNLTSVVNQDGNTWSYMYDCLSRVISVSNDLGMEEHYEYDAVGNIIKVTDGMGAATHYGYSAAGKLTSVVDALGNEAAYTYDVMDRLTSITQFEGLKTAEGVNALNDRQKSARSIKLQRDVLGNVIKMTDAIGNDTEYTYDHQANLTSVLDADGYLTECEYHADGRAKIIQYADGRSVKMSYNSLKQLAQVEDWLGITRIKSDPEGRPLQVADHNNETVRYAWSERGELQGMTYPDGSSIQYEYDDASRLTKASGPAGSVEYDHYSNGLLKARRHNGAGSSEYRYDNAGRLSSLTNSAPDGTLLDRFKYGYDKNGRKNAIDRQRPGMPDSGVFGYEFDTVGNLTGVTRNGSQEQSFTYDAYGNRTGMQAGAEKYSYNYDPADHLLGIAGTGGMRSFNYDKRGNMVEEFRDGALFSSLKFDATNRLVQATAANKRASYSYNGFGGRVGRRVEDINGAMLDEAIYSLDLTKGYNDLLSQRGSAGISNFFYDGALISAAGAGGPVSYMLDELQTPVRMTSGTGKSEGYAFDAFGGFLPAAGQAEALFGFCGFRRDDVSGLYFAQRREYAPDYGRFISRDPVDGNLTEPASMNRYLYCQNDPVNRVDFTGLIWAWVAGGIVGAAANVVGRVAGDVVRSVATGKPSFSSWQEYVGGAVGGFAQGATLVATGNPKLAGAAGGAAEALVTGGLQMLTDKNNPNTPKNVGELLLNTGISAGTGFATGFLFGKAADHIKIPGITSGRGSFDHVFRTQMGRAMGGHIANVSAKTLLKGAVSQGIGSFVGGLTSGLRKQLNRKLTDIGTSLWDRINPFRRTFPGARPLLPNDMRTRAICPLGA